MQMRNAIKIIIVLLIILILSLTLTLILMQQESGTPGKESDSHTQSDTDSAAPDGTSSDTDSSTPPANSSGTTTTDPITTDPVTTDPVTTDPVTTDPVTTPPVTDDPEPAPGDFAFEKTFLSDTGTPLNIRVVCRGVAQEDGTVRVMALLYLDYYSIGMGPRTGCRLSIGDASETFTLNAISDDINEPHSQYLCHVEKVCRYGETVSLYARVPFRGSYAGVAIDILEIDTDLTIE